jgi:RNA polymerase sigma factor (sigma-70 family)
LRLFSYFHRRFRERFTDLAKDLTAEVFETVYFKRHTFTPQIGSFSSWIYRIAHNKRVGILRRADIFFRYARLPLTEDMPHPLLDLMSPNAWLRHLPRGERDVIELTVFEGLSGSDVARILGLALGTVYSRKHRALNRLRKLLLTEATTPITQLQHEEK